MDKIKQYFIIALLLGVSIIVACAESKIDTKPSLKSFVNDFIKDKETNHYHVFWDLNRISAVIIYEKSNIENNIYLALKNNLDKYIIVDISLVEEKNLRAMSLNKRTHYDKIKTLVSKFNKNSSNNNLVITMKTIAIKNNKSKSYTQFLIVKKDGTVLWR